MICRPASNSLPSSFQRPANPFQPPVFSNPPIPPYGLEGSNPVGSTGLKPSNPRPGHRREKRAFPFPVSPSGKRG
jgi:hypothetical protein